VDHALSELQSSRPQFMRDRFRQSQAINASCNWDVRATQWQQAATGWLQNR
jgi:hypothetical protein